MSDTNRLSAVLTEAAQVKINAALAEIRANTPFLISLSNEERRSLAKLGDSRVALDEDAYQLMRDNPSLVPSYVDLEELTKDRVLRQKLDAVRLAVEALLNDIEATQIVAGSEMYNAYLAFYANAQEAAKRGVPSAQAVVDVLRKYFARPGRPAAAPKTS